MRRHSTWHLLVVSIVILSLVVENEVTAAPAPAPDPEPCGFGMGFGMERYPFRKPKEDKENDKREKLKKAGDTLFDDFRKFMKLL